jgi:hypothetical protein
MKICSKCKKEKNETDFYKNKYNKDGLHYWCKLCIIIWKNKNKNSVKEASRRCNEKHKEVYNKQRQEYKKEYAKRFPEKIKLSRNAWREKFPERYKLKNKQDYKKHIDRYTNNAHKRREIIENSNTDVDKKFLRELKKTTLYCKICGVNLVETLGPNQYNLDHIIPINIGGSHIKSNIRYICRKCNRARPKDGSDIDVLRKINEGMK